MVAVQDLYLKFGTAVCYRIDVFVFFAPCTFDRSKKSLDHVVCVVKNATIFSGQKSDPFHGQNSDLFHWSKKPTSNNCHWLTVTCLRFVPSFFDGGQHSEAQSLGSKGHMSIILQNSCKEAISHVAPHFKTMDCLTYNNTKSK